MFQDRDWKAKDIAEWRMYALVIIFACTLFIVYKIGYNRGEKVGTKDTTRAICEIIVKTADKKCVDNLLKTLEK